MAFQEKEEETEIHYIHRELQSTMHFTHCGLNSSRDGREYTKRPSQWGGVCVIFGICLSYNRKEMYKHEGVVY